MNLRSIAILAAIAISCSTNAEAQLNSLIDGAIRLQQQQQQQQMLLQQQQQEYNRQQQLQIQQEQQRQQQLLLQQQQQQRWNAQQRAQADARAKADAEARARQRQAEADRARAETEERARLAAEERRLQEISDRLRTDPILTTLVGPDTRDITVLIVGQDNQNVIRDLKGEPSFQNPVSACLPFGGMTPAPNNTEFRFLQYVRNQIETKGGAKIVLTACQAEEIGQYDLVLFSRNQLVVAEVNALKAVVDALRTRRLARFETYTISRFEADERARQLALQAEDSRQRAEQESARLSFQSRAPDLVSAIYLETPASVVCVISTPDSEGLWYLIKRTGSPLNSLTKGDSKLRQMASVDALFVALKRRDCLAAVAPAGSLQEIVSALARDGVKVGISAGTIDNSQIANWRTMLASEMAAAQAQQSQLAAEERRRQAEQAAEDEQRRRLAEQRRRNDEAARREELERQRKLVASRATAVMESFTDRIRKHMESVRLEIRDTQQRARTGQVLSSQQAAALRHQATVDRMGDSFQAWSSEFETLSKEGWEFGDIRPSLEDFGLAQWKARRIEAIAVRVEFPMLNRVIGERRTSCYEFVWINDEEFLFIRQAEAISCERFERDFTRWSQSTGFVSHWKSIGPTPTATP